MGHALAAAGITSLIKVLLCLQHRQLVPSLHYHTANEHIDFVNSPFYVNTQLKAWERIDNKPRLAAINSFGFSGTNAHVVIEEAAQQIISTQQNKAAYLLTISAKTNNALIQRIKDFN